MHQAALSSTSSAFGSLGRRALPVLAASLVVLLASPPPKAQAGLQETFEEGNEAFWSGNYQGAVESYERLLDLGVWDADLFYNLGTAYARMERFGPAILNFERALRIDPGHSDALDNLRTVRAAMASRRAAQGGSADLDPPRSYWMNLLSRVTAAQVALPFLIFWVGLFGAAAARRLLASELARLVLMIVTLLLAVGVAFSGALLFGKASYDSEVREAIAIQRDAAVVREGPGERFRRAFTALEGDRLRVVDREGDWMHLRARSGQEGWGSVNDFGEISRVESE